MTKKDKNMKAVAAALGFTKLPANPPAKIEVYSRTETGVRYEFTNSLTSLDVLDKVRLISSAKDNTTGEVRTVWIDLQCENLTEEKVLNTKELMQYQLITVLLAAGN